MISVVAAVLVVQVVASIAVSVTARTDAQSASRDIATLLGDSYTGRAVTVVRPASNTVRTLATQVADGTLDFDEPEEIARELYTFMRAHPPFASIAVRDGEGAWLIVRRARGGYVVAGEDQRGEMFGGGYDADFTPSEGLSLPRPGQSLANAPWAREAEAAREPLWIDPGDGAAHEEAVVAIGADGAHGPAMAAIGVAVRAIGQQVGNGSADDIAPAYLLTADRTVLAADSGGPMPEGLMTAAEAGLVDTSSFSPWGLGVVGTSGEYVVYERPLAIENGPEWLIYVAVEPAQVVPGIASTPQTMLTYSALTLALVVIAGLALWGFSVPLAEMAVRARTDKLTGLANRHEFDTRGRRALAEANRRGAEVLVIAIDLDHFKRVNDEVSHEAGDTVLRACGHALELHSDSRDVVARVGGDEFAMLHWLAEGEDPAHAVETLRAATHWDMVGVAPEAALTGLSAGFALASHHQYRLEAAFKAADIALVSGRRDVKGATYASAL